MRFGISTHLYHEQPLAPEHLQELAEFGFREVELFATIGHFDYHDARRPSTQLAALAATTPACACTRSTRRSSSTVVNGQWGPPLSTAAAAEQTRAHAVREARRPPDDRADGSRTATWSCTSGIPDDFEPPADDNARLAARAASRKSARRPRSSASRSPSR